MAHILLTGGLGLVGSGLARVLEDSGFSVEIMDVLGSEADGTFGDATRPADLHSRIARCDGVVHLAAVSRVIWGQRDPAACWRTNVGGLRNVLRAASERPRRPPPWIVLTSSREVYGQADRLPVHEDAPLKPMNVYARSKAAGEALMDVARHAGMKTAIARLSNVFGSTNDHPDRVVPAFARSAATGGRMRVEGKDNLLDFTWRDDVCAGLATLCMMMAREPGGPPPIQFVSGRGIGLLELAWMARAAAGGDVEIEISEARAYDVASFRGDPARAKALLGWEATTPFEESLRRLVAAYREEAAAGRAGRDQTSSAALGA